MENLFSTLTEILSGSSGLFLMIITAFFWGVLSLLLSPCHLTAVPLVVGYVNGQDKPSLFKGFQISSLFSVGMFLTIVITGAVTLAAGRLAGDTGPLANYILAFALLLAGLLFLDVIQFGGFKAKLPDFSRWSLWGALIMGLMFGVVLGPCTFAFLAPLLGIIFKMGPEKSLMGTALILLYSVGHVVVIIIAGTLSGWVSAYLNWNQKSNTIDRVRKVCGVLILFAGFYTLITA
jgi:cytochrome c-type biogenesis protein